ncbi:UNVERIFIED_ORG: hypothetical protein FHT06_001522 [Xanthomonas campestris]|uniref:hypothetical protein n=1 Tax=Xanthomonas arboricola TaxID=56448 RepID=UPI0016B36407
MDATFSTTNPPLPLTTTRGMVEERIFMVTAPATPVSAPFSLPPASARGLLCAAGHALRLLVTPAAPEQANDAPTHRLRNRLTVLPQTSCRLFVRSAVVLQHYIAATIRRNQTEAP